ncbi:hypothetical protein [uncultured Desulfosarcina sp.]|uniref:hypothetical protein n=1 Tax=uncultured Desulfosarcina sp. TaxID=218289 RepID=UPI0029C75580|nr:hypothetical protein [uncultured Desulfosarcina sp.]
MQTERDYSFFHLEFSSIVSLVCLLVVFSVAHIPGVLNVKVYGLSMHSWLLSLLALFIPVWNIIAANLENNKS